MFNNKIAIDLGTCNSLVYVQGRGVVLYEPSVVAISLTGNKILAVGENAKEMIGRTPADIKVYRPLKDGVIADYRVTQAMMRYFINKTSSRFKFFKPELVISVPAGITSTERRAVIEAALSSGAKSAYVAKEPILAAIGAGIPINSCSGHMIVNIGGGTSEVAVISLGGIVAFRSLRIAGDKLNDDIVQFAQKEYKLMIGERTAELIKMNIGSAMPLKEKKEMPMRGRNLVTGLPEEVVIFNDDVQRALDRSVKQIVAAIKVTIEETPPELLSDVMTNGIYLAGGGSLLRGLDTLISKETKMPCNIIDDPLTSVVRGAGIALENIETLAEVMSKDEEGEAYT